MKIYILFNYKNKYNINKYSNINLIIYLGIILFKQILTNN